MKKETHISNKQTMKGAEMDNMEKYDSIFKMLHKAQEEALRKSQSKKIPNLETENREYCLLKLIECAVEFRKLSEEYDECLKQIENIDKKTNHDNQHIAPTIMTNSWTPTKNQWSFKSNKNKLNKKANYNCKNIAALNISNSWVVAKNQWSYKLNKNKLNVKKSKLPWRKYRI